MEVLQEKILRLLRNKDEDITINDIAESIKAERHTTAKHLEVLKSRGLIEYRSIGKSKVWKISRSPFIKAIKTEDEVIKNFKDILNSVDNHISIQNPDFSVIWTNKNISQHKCYEAVGKDEKCKNCPIEKTFRTGQSTSALVDWQNKKVRIIAQPIKNSNNETVAVVEIVQNVKKEMNHYNIASRGKK